MILRFIYCFGKAGSHLVAMHSIAFRSWAVSIAGLIGRSYLFISTFLNCPFLILCFWEMSICCFHFLIPFLRFFLCCWSLLLYLSRVCSLSYILLLVNSIFCEGFIVVQFFRFFKTNIYSNFNLFFQNLFSFYINLILV